MVNRNIEKYPRRVDSISVRGRRCAGESSHKSPRTRVMEEAHWLKNMEKRDGGEGELVKIYKGIVGNLGVLPVAVRRGGRESNWKIMQLVLGN